MKRINFAKDYQKQIEFAKKSVHDSFEKTLTDFLVHLSASIIGFSPSASKKTLDGRQATHSVNHFINYSFMYSAGSTPAVASAVRKPHDSYAPNVNGLQDVINSIYTGRRTGYPSSIIVTNAARAEDGRDYAENVLVKGWKFKKGFTPPYETFVKAADRSTGDARFKTFCSKYIKITHTSK